ncbi:hypothetical protein SD70_11000 [Gordoniibacillus kamchatkensis]|uniref:HTH araC/xylS-type domain-containing protein n=1 Tax=Gordoniibacillus kamchatkensis TaxID=1590651 RepID=A0ABR5AIA6_9BACL|nr:AraC family transcriptional regulator [Paenibacillus sp. VKM B-2647]KIL40772.1 hypothetical protein SD70_11000 [Paenibacillus sp. VKM B-2647]
MQELTQHYEPASTLPLYLKSVQTGKLHVPGGSGGSKSSFVWIQPLSPQGTLQIEDERIQLASGEGVLLYAADNRVQRIHSRDAIFRAVTFGGTLALSLLSSFQLAPGLYGWDEKSVLSAFLRNSWEASLDNKDYTDLEGSNLLYTFLVLLKQCAGWRSPVAAAKRAPQFEKLLCHLQNEYADPELGIETMAKVMGVSPQHLHAMFKKYTGVSPYSYLLHLRLDKSKELLLCTDYTVKKIAAMVGFRDVCHYIASFRKSTGWTPEKYRSREAHQLAVT